MAKGDGVGVGVAKVIVGVADTVAAVDDGVGDSAEGLSGSPAAIASLEATSIMAVSEATTPTPSNGEASAGEFDEPEQPTTARASRTDAISHIRICLGLTDTLRQGFH